jgi:hypothetical protein
LPSKQTTSLVQLHGQPLHATAIDVPMYLVDVPTEIKKVIDCFANKRAM